MLVALARVVIHALVEPAELVEALLVEVVAVGVVEVYTNSELVSLQRIFSDKVRYQHRNKKSLLVLTSARQVVEPVIVVEAALNLLKLTRHPRRLLASLLLLAFVLEVFRHD